MKKMILAMVICLATASGLFAADKVVIGMITDMARKNSFKLMTPDEYKIIAKQIATEKKNFEKALKAAAKAWEADEAKAGKRFPKSAAKPRKISMKGKPSTDRTKALTKLYKLQDKEMNDVRDDQLARQRVWRKIAKKRGLGKKEKCKAQIEYEEEEALEEEARVLVGKELFALMQPAE